MMKQTLTPLIETLCWTVSHVQLMNGSETFLSVYRKPSVLRASKLRGPDRRVRVPREPDGPRASRVHHEAGGDPETRDVGGRRRPDHQRRWGPSMVRRLRPQVTWEPTGLY